ncbi:hypothetical protein FQS88_14620 [Enterococcus casseliflavus]|nr:hypothetical protein [Enterococcus casseliflavus]
MATFGKFETTIVPSQEGSTFEVATPVLFTFHGKKQTGTITKQLKNSAVVELNETPENQKLVSQSNGVLIINYKQLTKL